MCGQISKHCCLEPNNLFQNLNVHIFSALKHCFIVSCMLFMKCTFQSSPRSIVQVLNFFPYLKDLFVEELFCKKKNKLFINWGSLQ